MDANSQEDSLNEVKILSSLDNLYIVKYFDSFVEENKLYIIMEYCEKGDVSKFIKTKPNLLKEQRIWEIFLQTCLGLEYLHSKKILHRDIKTLNIFLYDEKYIRIGDLGVARVLSSTTTFAHTVIGTPYYLSPELCEEKPYNVKSDVWALGCVLHELCTLKKPFEASNPGALILKILRSSYPPISSTFSSELREIVRLCLQKDQKKRPDIQTMLKRPGIREKILSFGLQIPEKSVLFTASTIKMPISKSIDNAEEEKSVQVVKKKFTKSQNTNSKKVFQKPRVRKGAPQNSKKPNCYAKQPVSSRPKQIVKVNFEDEVKSVVNLPSYKPMISKAIEEEEPSINDEPSYEIIPSAPPPMPLLTVNTVQVQAIMADSSSDDQSYHSDDKELFAVREVDEKLERTDNLRFKLQEIERNEKEYERIIEQRRNELVNTVGVQAYEELYEYFREKYSSEKEMNEDEQESVQRFIIDKLGDPNSEAIYGMCRLLNLENELLNCKDAAADIKFRML
ncbi:hypothetical protein SteCoe_21631 [Stentor coeruleus]|uniref:non-specific serine/threonine protein kinase n=1 Tax=Stentor coeruleus TaxID=5963 RepID=A0A1R2BP75_9CILI|nr:hypothetical protein SteCoe_21631 [Stentor coeruleus]